MARERAIGLVYIFLGRLVCLAILSIWALSIPFERSTSYLVAIAVFAGLGAIQYAFARKGLGGTPLLALFVLVDAGLLTYVLVVPPTVYIEGWTAQLNTRLPNFLFLAVFLVSMALSYSPGLVVWAGCACVATWTLGFLWIAQLPNTVLSSASHTLDAGLSSKAVIDSFLDPRTVSLTAWYNQVAFIVLATLILTTAVWRARQLVRRQVAAEHERANLSRYFSPNIVRELSIQGSELDRSSVMSAAVLFADMVGFTRLSENLPPDRLMMLLREFHGRLAQIAFAHGGTVDKYIGDAIMVHFGAPRPREDDPVRALSCAATMVKSIAEWSDTRARNGEERVGIGVGVHYGEVVVGNIGHERRLEYAVVGDTVNVASRLERLTRHSSSAIVVSDALVNAVRSLGHEPCDLLPGLRPDANRFVRGRYRPIGIWSLGTPPARNPT